MVLTTILYKVSFLVSISILGFILGKKTEVEAYSLSKVLLYVIAPIVIFFLVASKEFNLKYLLLSLGSFLLCSTLSLIALSISRFFWQGKNRNLFAFSGGTGNTGYFGLPMVVYTLGSEAGAIAAFIILGVTLYEFTVGYFITAQDDNNKIAGLIKVIKLPVIYAFLLAFLVSFLRLPIPYELTESFSIFTGAYSVLGMMIIGITLSKVIIKTIDWKFVLLSNIWKYLVFPTVGFIIINIFNLQLDILEKAVIIIMCCVPMAGNTVVLANELQVHPDKAAVAVMTSTILAIIFIPFYLHFFKII